MTAEKNNKSNNNS